MCVTTINEQPATVEELYKNHFAKLINNDGENAKLLEDADDALKDLFAKAVSGSLHICIIQQTTHPTRSTTTSYSLYDSEIATNVIMNADSMECYFCCGNCSSVGITGFIDVHAHNDYCKMMGLSQL